MLPSKHSWVRFPGMFESDPKLELLTKIQGLMGIQVEALSMGIKTGLDPWALSSVVSRHRSMDILIFSNLTSPPFRTCFLRQLTCQLQLSVGTMITSSISNPSIRVIKRQFPLVLNWHGKKRRTNSTAASHNVEHCNTSLGAWFGGVTFSLCLPSARPLPPRVTNLPVHRRGLHIRGSKSWWRGCRISLYLRLL